MKILGPVTYKLDLPDSIRIIKIRHILVLELVDPETPLIKNIPDIDLESHTKFWKIKKILDVDLINNS